MLSISKTEGADVLATTRQALVDWVWHCWIALGVGTWDSTTASVDFAIDPEALLACTAPIADEEPRLANEAIAWATEHGVLLSKKRLQNFAKYAQEIGSPTGSASVFYDELLSKITKTPKEEATRRRFFGRQREPNLRPLDLAAPAAYALRLRNIFGTTQRAEIIRSLTAYSPSFVSVSTISNETLGTKPSVATTLTSLANASIVESVVIGNRVEYRLKQPTILFELAGSRPQRMPNWRHLLKIFDEAMQLTQPRDLDAIDATLDATQFSNNISQATGQLRLDVDPLPTRAVKMDDATKWISDLFSHL